MESAVQARTGRSKNNETDSESNSFDKNDDMSEDDLTVLGGKGTDLPTMDGSEDDDGQKSGKKRGRGVKKKVKVEGGTKAKSKVWDVFDKVIVPDPSEKDKMLSKAKCKYCKKLYSRVNNNNIVKAHEEL
jgi:hypothetical protein